MFVVGLTGGIGSGKTRVSNTFQELGIAVVDTDLIAREVVALGSRCLTKIHQRYGDSMLLSDGTLNRKRLRDIIFSEPQEKEWVESLLHPLIRKQTQRQLSEAKSPYCMLVSPLLLESPDAERCDKILVVDAPTALQIQRTLRRDNVSKEQVERTISTQMQHRERTARADDLIDNSGEWTATYAQILPLHEKYLQCAKVKANAINSN